MEWDLDVSAEDGADAIVNYHVMENKYEKLKAKYDWLWNDL